MEHYLKDKLGDDFDDDMLETMFATLDTDESGHIDVLEFAAAENDTKAKAFKKLYLEMEKTFVQFEVCRQFFFYILFTTVYFTVVFMQLDISIGYEVEAMMFEDLGPRAGSASFVHG